MSHARSFLLLLLTVVTFLIFAEAFRFSIIPATTSAAMRRSLRSVDNPTFQSISCSQLLGRHNPEFMACLMASKDVPQAVKFSARNILPSRFFKLPHHHLKNIPLYETKIAAKLSRFSYLEEVSEDSAHDGGDLPIVVESDPIAQTRAHVWINKKSKTAYVSFRGTSSWVDVLHDLDTRPVPVDDDSEFPEITVHAGFRYKFFSIKKDLEDVLLSHLDEFNNLVLTGHSLGGALATIAAPIFADRFITKTVTCISFGSPRVGNKNFVDWFNSAVDFNVRVINEHDAVPHLPLGPAYHHVSDAVCIVPDSDIYSFAEIPVGERLFWAVENLDLSQLTTAHDLETYITRVNMYN